MVACVASVPVRSERNSGSVYQFFEFGMREKWGESKKVEGRGWGRGKKVPCLPLAHPLPSTFLLLRHFSCGPNFVRFVRERLLRRLK